MLLAASVKVSSLSATFQQQQNIHFIFPLFYYLFFFVVVNAGHLLQNF
jgi:hypothetical protein